MESHRPGNAEDLSSGSFQKVNPRVSICIVTYRARDLLRECLFSIEKNTQSEFEVIVIDNHSNDGTREMLGEEFPTYSYFENQINEGFTKPMNHALRAGKGIFLVMLNPDTVVLPKAFDRLANFLEENPAVGICGPRVMNPDGTLQKSCRRGESRPWAVISYFSGLAKLFPKSRFFGGYWLSYLDENEVHRVDGVSGSCMMVKREVFNQIGYLDERFFAYQEDADFCFRARQAGWQVFYMPESEVIHFGSLGGSHVNRFRSVFEWHKSYYLHYKKNLSKDYFFFFNWIFYLGMVLKLILALFVAVFQYIFRGSKQADTF